jgi:hypothetical protein
MARCTGAPLPRCIAARTLQTRHLAAWVQRAPFCAALFGDHPPALTQSARGGQAVCGRCRAVAECHFDVPREERIVPC